MGWSSRQVWGFTTLMLGVVVMAIVSMVTLVLLLIMDGPPEGQPLLIATPTNTPPTDEVQTSSLAYYCPNERSVLVENIVEKCGCVPCIHVPVVFVGMVTNTDNESIPMATVKVNNTDYQTNENGMFGFSVSSLQEEVVMDVVATGYWDYKRLLRVLPGKVNILQVRLMKKIIRKIPATPHSVIISTLDFQLLDSNLTSVSRVRVETVVQFPRGVFRQGATLIGQPVAMGNKASLEGLGMSFITGAQSEGERRRKREGGEGRVVFVVSVGMFNVEGEGGRETGQ
ncbi:hypothetical protein GBAR_LOCUS31766 [Geodia barretti]|uniref:Uncharacterized protein n=1 Tax=Geodia barretti TaxID=519541 RepID=A0AA35U3W2_GEOBA|nr:hypothetical protein GBAR_LOCUS31766 [Geodia barretti]